MSFNNEIIFVCEKQSVFQPANQSIYLFIKKELDK